MKIPGADKECEDMQWARFSWVRGVRRIALTTMSCLALGGPVLGASAAQPPHSKRNLVVQLRFIAPEQPMAPAQKRMISAPFVLRTHNGGTELPAVQTVVVAPGERAHFQWAQTMLVQWTQAALQQTSISATVGGGAGVHDARGVENNAAWLATGQSLVVQPRWAAGRGGVILEVQTQKSATADAHLQANTPHQAHTRVATTLLVPLGQWTTIATLGEEATAAPTASTYSSRVTPSAHTTLMQVQVLAP